MNAKKLSSCLIVVLVAACSVFWASCTSESPKLQQVAIVELTNVTSTSFECLVKVNPNGSSTIVERGVLYDTREWKGEKLIKSDSNSDSFSVKIENLLSGASYGVRAYARTDKGVVYSALVAVITPIAQGEVKDIEDNVYKTIKIGTQEWMVENLRTTKYNNGTTIKNGTAASAWRDDKLGAYALYTGADKAVHGYLYNGWAVRKLATGSATDFLLPPTGWRVPTHEDWNAFQEFLTLHGYGTADDDLLVGISLASNSLWKASPELETIGFDLTQNNKTGFGAVPAGFRLNAGTFNKGVGVGEGAYFWAGDFVAKPSGTDQLLYFASLSYDNGKLNLENAELNDKNPGASVRANGLSVRCMRDIK